MTILSMLRVSCRVVRSLTDPPTDVVFRLEQAKHLPQIFASVIDKSCDRNTTRNHVPTLPHAAVDVIISLKLFFLFIIYWKVSMTYLLFTALLITLGVGLLGGALFGRIRQRRFNLLSLSLVLWIGAALVFTSCSAPSDATLTNATATMVSEVAEVELPAIAETTVTPEPTATVIPSPAPTVTFTPTPEPSLGYLVFPSARSGNLDLWLMDLTNPDDLTLLTKASPPDVEPRWSPDGSKILFSTLQGTEAGMNDLWMMNADGSEPHPVIDWPESYEWGATWSPDGDQIAFTSTRDFDYEIYITDAEGEGEPINLTDNENLDSYPDWSADGRWLVFVSDRSQDWEIWKIDVEACLPFRRDGAGEESACEAIQLTDSSGDDFFPRWSPDGSRIVFSSIRDANRNIYVMDADGSNVVQLTNSRDHDSMPMWALDGEAIIFSSKRMGDWGIYIMNADGTGERLLVDAPGEDRFGDWWSGD
jgi:Tol biopolymer transport system component